MSEKPGGHETSFEERLAAARDKQGLNVAPSDAGRSPDGLDGNALAIGMRVGVEMVSALVVAVAIGWGLDYLLGTRPILLAVFVLLGGAAGVLNVWRVFAPKHGPASDKGVHTPGMHTRGVQTKDVHTSGVHIGGVGRKDVRTKDVPTKDRGP
jgi:ATP synthase protein I